jgi:tetratricopeptide (TPR) repeat protein
LLAVHELVGMFDMLAGAIEEERRERITIRRGRPSKKAKALAKAESLVEAAEGFETERAREIARKALELSPDCARAHVLLAELSDDVHAAEREYRLGVAAGERALGAAVIERHIGDLGRVAEARGLLLAHRGLAECLSIMGRPEEAIAECERLAALDTEDHAVARFMHLDLLITSREFAAARRLCDECQEEVFCHWPFGRALAAFGEGGDTPEARRLLAAAIAVNPHVPRVLLSGREVDPDGMVTVGEEDEAELYVRDFRRCWMDVPGAIAWLRAAADVPVERGRRHDRPDRHEKPVREPHPHKPSWSEEKRLLGQLPLDPTDEWEADLREDREGTWCFHVASARDERPVALDVLEDRPLPDDLWSGLAGAMRRPTHGEPRRPATLAVRPGVFPKTWRRKLEQIGIRQVVQGELPTIARIVRDVEARVAAAEADRAADAHDPAAATAAVLAACADLPREPGDVWEAAVRRAPAWVTGEGQPYLPWIALVVSSGDDAGLLGADMSRERPAAEAVVRLVGRAIEKTGVRPDRVDVAAADLHAALGVAFAAIDVPVGLLPTVPTVEWAMTTLAESMTPPDALAPLSAVPGISSEIGRAFYAAAAAFHRDQTWRRLPSDAAITVHVPGGDGGEGRVVHVVVMGQSGIVQGIAVYEDDPALEIARSGDLERTAGSTGLSVMFGEAFEIPAVDYDWIETQGFEVAGPEAWPQPVRQNPGMNLRPPLVWEIELLTGCLRDVPAFIAAVPPGNRGAAGSRDAMEWTSVAGWRLAWESA